MELPTPGIRWGLRRLVPVQRPHHPNPRQHFRPVALGDQHQRFHRDLPIGRIMVGFRQRGDVFGGVAQRQQLAARRRARAALGGVRLCRGTVRAVGGEFHRLLMRARPRLSSAN
jgi:hypothetical protein